MATTTRPNQKPGKLSSKFGAAFAAFENNSGESNVPQAFRSATTTRKTKPNTTTGQTRRSNSSTPLLKKHHHPNVSSSSEEKPRTRFSQSNSFQRRSVSNTEKASEMDNNKHEQDQPSAQTPSAAAERTNSTAEDMIALPTTPGKRNFRVSSKLVANRAMVFESSNSKNNSSSTTTTTTTDTALLAEDKHIDDDDSECYGYIDLAPVKETVHSTIDGVCSDGEYEEFWEEETLDSTEEADDWTYQSWEEETIVDDRVLLEEEENEEEVVVAVEEE
ncbi:unnamed protein product [Cylindrotheca closterium]|uniref:Uncharacterized protein n=1 Tax=Cylindrotheca closterium TaxID=2856 RepID=A0AAD2G8I2_9STRA|nr:unnamed protein product [Cylindrotheca closterium]